MKKIIDHTMTESFKAFLQTEEAAELSKLIDTLNADTLKIHAYLRKHDMSASQMEFLSEMLLLRDLRIKASEKFSMAGKMIFTRRGLEQSTGEIIAEYKASWVHDSSHILVLCSGIGGEMISLAKKAKHVTALDKDPEMCSIAMHNAEVYDVEKKITCISDTAESFLEKHIQQFDAVYIDPDRRHGDTRKVELSHYLPNIYEILPHLLEISPHVYCKVSPRIYRNELEKLPHLFSYEFIQEEQDLKECVLHFTKTPKILKKIATKIIQNKTIHFSTEDEEYEKTLIENEEEMLTYLYEPDASLMRATLVEKCAQEIGGLFLTEKGALLTTALMNAVGQEWGTYFEIKKVLPFHPLTIKNYCKEHSLEKIILKKRYFPLEPHEIRKFLKIKEGGNDIFYCTTIGEKKVIIHCRRVLP